MSDRDFDIVLLGATGFTGRLIAERLASAAPDGARLALAGRSEIKLAAVAAGLSREVGLCTVDATDARALARLAEGSPGRALALAVGPYTQHGDPVVAACAAAGTDYLDLCGEPEFVDETYLRHHATALASGARLVHACGFDSIPHDLGVQLTVAQLPPGVPIAIRGYVTMDGRFSGGTAASALEAMSRMRQARQARARRCAVEGPADGRTVTIGTARPGRSRDTGRWAMAMPTIDPQIVADSARHLSSYGPDFTYTHLLDAPSALALAGTVAGVGALVGLAQIPPARRALSRRVPQGTGPSAERRATSSFTVRFFGEADGRRVATEVSGGDPGYTETATMMTITMAEVSL